MHRRMIVFSLTISLFMCSPALGWSDMTHMAVMKAAGLGDLAYMAVGADMAKVKSGGYEDGNHYCDNKKDVVVTAEMVLDQTRDYDCRCNDQGHLYGAIVAALDQYEKFNHRDKYALGFAAHYIADLSNPLHNMDYNDFNKTHHAANDSVVEKGEAGSTNEKVARIARNIQQRMKGIAPYRFPTARAGIRNFNFEVAKKVAGIANKAKALGYAMQDAIPPRTLMSQDEAYRQLAESARLLQAAFAAMQ